MKYNPHLTTDDNVQNLYKDHEFHINKLYELLETGDQAYTKDKELIKEMITLIRNSLQAQTKEIQGLRQLVLTQFNTIASFMEAQQSLNKSFHESLSHLQRR